MKRNTECGRITKMKDYRSLNHTKWDCKYRVVFIPKKRKERIFGASVNTLGMYFMNWPCKKNQR
jgi:putative transposase